MYQSQTPETYQSPALPPRVSKTIATRSPGTEHRVFSIYSPAVTFTFTSDSGATDILMRQRDSHITTLHHVHLHSRTTWLRRCQLSANIPYRARETTHSPHIYITHGIRLQRRRPTLQSVRRLTPHRTRPISHIYI